MADIKQGDRVVKMSGICAGKYGTVNSVMENGTLNVTFDGDRLPKYCDPEKCGAVATNAAFKKGDRVKLKGSSKLGTVVGGPGTYIGAGSLGGGSDYPGDVTVRWDSYKFDVPVKPENLVFANSRARAANVKVGDKIVLVADAGVWRKGATGAIVGGDYLPGFLYVKFDDGSEGRIPEAKMAANAARNALEPRTGDAKKIEDALNVVRDALRKAHAIVRGVGREDIASLVLKAAETINRARF